jgi:small subunit ribosomal protein S8
MLTRIRNALQRGGATVDVAASRTCRGVLAVMQAEGYIHEFDEIQDGRQGIIRVHLKYGPDGEKVVTHIKRESKPSRHIYKKVDEIQPVLGGLGINILTTPRGVMTGREARKQGVGGEVLCRVE